MSMSHSYKSQKGNSHSSSSSVISFIITIYYLHVAVVRATWFTLQAVYNSGSIIVIYIYYIVVLF